MAEDSAEKPPPNNPEITRSTPIIGGLIYLKDKFTRKPADTSTFQPELTQPDEPQAVHEEVFTPPSQPQISRQERRQVAKDTYSSQRAGQTPATAVSESAPAPVVAAEPTKTRISNLPDAFESVEQKAGLTFNPTLENMPWLDEPGAKLAVNLAKFTLKGSGEQFYFGSFIRGKKLVKAAELLDSHRKQSADNLLYKHIQDIIRSGLSPFAKTLINPNSDTEIFYFSHQNGLRVYFMRFQLNNDPVIIRVAVCDKANQSDVLEKLAHRSRK